MRFIILIIIVIVALAAGFFTLQFAIPKEEVVVTEEPKLEAVEVVVARAPIPIGTVITEEMVDLQPWPKHLLLDGFVVSGAPDSNVVGMVARADFQQQEPLIRFKLANPSDANFIAAALPAGMRAVTLSVDAISGIAGYVFAGDRVDVTFVHNIPGKIANKSGDSAFSETLLKDVSVLAIDLNGEAEARRKQAELNPQAVEGAPVPRNITLAMSDVDVQKLRLAEKVGVLSLALRSLKDRNVAGESPVTSLRVLTAAEVADAAQPKQRDESVLIVRGVAATKNILANPDNTAPPIPSPNP